MASMIPIASQEKFDSISPARSNGQAVNLELESRDPKARATRADSLAASSDGSGGETGAEPQAPPSEPAKTLACAAALLLVAAANLLSVAAAGRRLPATLQDANQTHPPLRDVAYDAWSSAAPLRRHQLALVVAAEAAVVASSVYVLGAVIARHPHRCVVLRRFCFVLALLFGVRLLTMNVTMLPVSSATLYQCRAADRPAVGAHLAQLAARLGLSVDGRIRYCGNYVFNGHAVLLVLNCLWLDEYGAPSRLLAVAAKATAAASLVALVAAGYDYTISMVVAYYATTRVFWIYHTLAHNVALKRYDPVNQVCKEWWYPMFRYLEGNVRQVVSSPRKFQ